MEIMDIILKPLQFLWRIECIVYWRLSYVNKSLVKTLISQFSFDNLRARKEPAGTTVEDVFAAKRAYASTYHPESGDKMWLPGRMSSQVPCNMIICGLMMTFYRYILRNCRIANCKTNGTVHRL